MALDNTITGMQTDISRTQRIKNLIKQSGWQDIIDIFQELYEENLNVLQDKEDISARTMLTTLERILAKVDDSVNLGKVQAERFARKFKNIAGKEYG